MITSGTEFQLEYEPGELMAVGYKKGREALKTVLKTAGKPASIRLTPDRSRIRAKAGELSYITAEIIDKAGNVVHNASNNIYFTASGAGKLLAVGSGNPVSEEMYAGNCRRAYEGRAMAVAASKGEPGEIILTASAEGLLTANVKITAED